MFVPKQRGIGQTLNFARAASWAFLVGVVAVPLVITWVTVAVAGK